MFQFLHRFVTEMQLKSQTWIYQIAQIESTQ